MKATEVTAGLAESNGSLLPGLWRDSLHVTCRLTACTPGSAPGPTLGNEYGKTLPLSIALFAVNCFLWSDRPTVWVCGATAVKSDYSERGSRLATLHVGARCITYDP